MKIFTSIRSCLLAVKFKLWVDNSCTDFIIKDLLLYVHVTKPCVDATADCVIGLVFAVLGL